MAHAIQAISVRRGHDVTGLRAGLLRRGGGAARVRGGGRAGGSARSLFDPLGGVLSAYGMGLAEQGVMRDGDASAAARCATGSRVALGVERAAAAGGAELVAQGVRPEGITPRPRAVLRYEGTDTALPVAWGADAAQAQDSILARLREGFEAAYRQRFAFLLEGRGLVIESVVVEALGQGGEDAFAAGLPVGPRAGAARLGRTRLWAQGHWQEAPLLDRGGTGRGRAHRRSGGDHRGQRDRRWWSRAGARR